MVENLDRTILGYGASTMQGVGDSKGGWFARITRAMATTHPTWKFVNLGVGGYTTREMLKQIDRVEQYRPFTSVIILGCNDLPRDRDTHFEKRTTVDEYSRNLDAFLPKLAGPGSLFISSFPPDAVTRGVQLTTMETYLGQAMRLARKHGFKIWDLLSEMKNNPALPGYWAPDGMHFNDTGHAMLAERVTALLTSDDARPG
jgi:lysophospholipase L1-like esterase